MRRARPRSSRMLMFLSVVLAVLTTLALRGHLARLEAAAAAGGPGEPVVVTLRGLERGTVLGAEMLETRRVPARYRPPGALSRPSQALGRTLATELVPGEAVTSSRLAASGGPVAALVPLGLRAVPVVVAVPRGVVVSGDRVDVLATFATGQPHTQTVVAGAEVLAVLPPMGPDELGAGTTLMLLVGPEVAEQLAYARAFADVAVAIAPPQEGV